MGSKTLYVIGSGQNPVNHLTLEAVRNCKKADKLLTVCGNTNGVLEAIGGHKNHEDIVNLYFDGAIDNDNYNRIIHKILNECEHYDVVAITTAGHPLLGVSWWERLKKHSQFKANLIYVEGISSLTSMFVELERDPLETGSIIIDANRCLIFEYEINPELDLYVFNFCSTGTRKTHINEPYKENRLGNLKDHLLKFYNSNTKVKMVSAKHGNMPCDITEVYLCDLENILPNVKFYSSLYIPGINPRHYNRNFVINLLGI